ncbi:MAG: hypothetical protein D6732_17790, partial [Methanobacteriota archaeon]
NNQNHTYVFKNQCENNNSAPNAPAITNVIPSDSSITIQWMSSGDDHTSNNLLSYNLSVSDEYYESNIVSSCSRLDGIHLTSDLGNIGHQDTWTVTRLTSGKLYYFKLQAVDAGRMASQFSDPLGLPVLNDRYMEVIKLPFALERGIAADFNQDGMMDVIGERSGASSTIYFRTYYNNGYPSFEQMMEDLPQNLQNQEFCAGDMNGDGYVDVLINGYNSEFSGYGTYIYLYNPVSQHFEPTSYSPIGPMKSIEIGDMDNDGDLDLIGKGTFYPYNLRLMLNQGDGFAYMPINFAPYAGDFEIGDIDNDGDIDIISNVSSTTDTCVLAFLFNRNGTFITDTTALRAPESAVFQLLDFDNDGDLDLLATGHKSTSNVNNPWHRTCYIYENQHANFILKDTLETAALDEASIDVGDFDNDGDTDFIIRGYKRGDSFASTTSLFLNDGTGNFIRYIDSYLPIYKLNGTAFAIKTLTQNLDFVLTGVNNNLNGYSSLVMNTMIPDLNQPPSTPQNLKAEVTPDSIVFSWDASTDDHTPSAALTYNLRIGTSSGQGNIKPSHTKDNILLVARVGNVGHVTRWVLKNPPTTGSIYWTVQAVDNSYRTSEFAPEQVIVLTDISENDGNLPKKFALHQNYPNPFNPATEIKFDVPKISHVTIKIYNALGQLVTTLVDEEMKPGYHKIKW